MGGDSDWGRSAEEKERNGQMLLRLWREEESQDLVEYALLLALISLIAVASITTVGCRFEPCPGSRSLLSLDSGDWL